MVCAPISELWVDLDKEDGLFESEGEEEGCNANSEPE